MQEDLIAKASTSVQAPKDKVWQALVTPEAIEQYMFGTEVASTWEPGSAITWKGEMNGKAYEDKGEILQLEPEKLLQYTHFSPLSGEPDSPENYHTVTVELAGTGDETVVTLTQDNNADEAALEESSKNWGAMLEGLKKYVEGSAS